MITRPRLMARRIAMPSLGCIIPAPCSRSPPMPTTGRLGVRAQLRWARAKCRQRRLRERSPELERIFDNRFKIRAGRLAGERVFENRGNRDASQRGAGGRTILAIDLFDESDGLADIHDVL